MRGKHVRKPVMLEVLGETRLEYFSVIWTRSRTALSWNTWTLCRTLMAEPWLGEGIGQLSIIATSRLSSYSLLFLHCMEYS